MKVYLIYRIVPYNGAELDSIWSNLDTANKRVEELKSNHSFAVIKEYEINKII